MAQNVTSIQGLCLQHHFSVFYSPKLNATKNNSKKYKKFKILKQPSWLKSAQISDSVL